MGKSFMPKYRAEYRCQDQRWNVIAWNVTAGTNRTGHGRPSDANAEKLRVALNRSFANGGVNYHVSQGAGYILHILELRVIRQDSGDIVAAARAPMFEVM